MRGVGELLCPGAFDAVRERLFGLGTGNPERGFRVLGTLFSGECGGLRIGDESHFTHERVCPCVERGEHGCLYGKDNFPRDHAGRFALFGKNDRNDGG